MDVAERGGVKAELPLVLVKQGSAGLVCAVVCVFVRVLIDGSACFRALKAKAALIVIRSWD